MFFWLLGLSFIFYLPIHADWSITHLSDTQIEQIGRCIWRNESGESREKLVWWNKGEVCASLGIGHFIWYPKDSAQGFSQTFPALLTFFKQHGRSLPPWLAQAAVACPWNSYQEFQQARANHNPRMHELQQLLESTIGLQACFMVERCKEALDSLMREAAVSCREKLRTHIDALLASEQGVYVLVDYINFKGLGINPHERYGGKDIDKGWGLLQALLAMPDTYDSPCAAFARAADYVLTRRVAFAPAEAHEERWLAGWKARIKTYANNTKCSKSQKKDEK